VAEEMKHNEYGRYLEQLVAEDSGRA
jgi:hypothetical protein